MKMTNGSMLGFFAALGGLRTRGMPAKLAWKLVVNETMLKPYASAFDTTATEIRERYADKDKAGVVIRTVDANGIEHYVIPAEGLVKANKELSEFLEEAFEVFPVELTLHDFPDQFEVTPELMGLLAPIMELTAPVAK